ncbi:Uncharacterised protein [Yersinia frederiksenii]|uniref:hypothetical protein n=1 Tax=Yersinia frederiksenii TaxID=29484 RepID=UPI0005E761AC|nr:hypothetical protein [Yersinia frederiksenii]CNB48707.1 Uncharacterised protein [Yersinia frederiksenii]
MSPLAKRIINYIGTVLALIGLIFIALKLYNYGIVAIFANYSIFDWVIVGGLALAYGLANTLLSIAWWCILAGLGIKVDCYWAVRTYAITQVTKYVPGNIFQFVGRQALGMAKGLPAWALVKSSVWEIGLIAFCGSLFGFFILPIFIDNYYINTWVCLILFLLTVFLSFVVLRKYLNPDFSKALLCYIIFLIISGLLFLALVFIQNKSFEISGVSNVFILCGTYIIAWLVGLITPGAPAGVGIRELILLFLLNGIIEENNLLSAILLGRLVTIGGDALFYIIFATTRLKKGESNV